MPDTLAPRMQVTRAGTEGRDAASVGFLLSLKFCEVSRVAMTASGHFWDRLGVEETQRHSTSPQRGSSGGISGGDDAVRGQPNSLVNCLSHSEQRDARSVNFLCYSEIFNW